MRACHREPGELETGARAARKMVLEESLSSPDRAYALPVRWGGDVSQRYRDLPWSSRQAEPAVRKNCGEVGWYRV